MSRKIRYFLSAALVAVFVLSTALLGRYLYHRHQNRQARDLALEIAGGVTVPPSPEATLPAESPSLPQSAEISVQPTEPAWIPAPFRGDPSQMAVLENIDLDALRQVNPQVIGWIYIPDTGIHFPLLQGTDNTFYLDHSWDLRSNVLGSIFLETRNSPDLSDFNTILYGHNIAGGEMFAPLHNYSSETYRRSHPYIYILTDSGIFRYEIFASFFADTDSPTYGLSFHQTATRENFLAFALENSQIHTGITPNLTDRFLTLSTCTGRGHDQRRVVIARMEMIPENEKTTAETSAVAE